MASRWPKMQQHKFEKELAIFQSKEDMDPNRINELNREAAGLRDRLQTVEENRASLQNNRQFNQAHEQYED